MEKNILIVGVGGQGTLLASRILGALASILELDCKLSEIHGMSQRGGSVVTHVRIGKEIASPIISEGDADFILSFEELEALRWCHYLKEDGLMLINSQQIMPMPVIIGSADYPKDSYQTLTEKNKNFVAINALELASSAGSTKAVNVVLLGLLAKKLGIPYQTIAKAMEMSIPVRFLEMNKKALELGYNYKGE